MLVVCRSTYFLSVLVLYPTSLEFLKMIFVLCGFLLQYLRVLDNDLAEVYPLTPFWTVLRTLLVMEKLTHSDPALLNLPSKESKTDVIIAMEGRKEACLCLHAQHLAHSKHSWSEISHCVVIRIWFSDFLKHF